MAVSWRATWYGTAPAIEIRPGLLLGKLPLGVGLVGGQDRLKTLPQGGCPAHVVEHHPVVVANGLDHLRPARRVDRGLTIAALLALGDQCLALGWCEKA